MGAARIVIVGSGFAGVTLAQRLERSTPAEVEIVLISASNHLVFSPMLAEVVGWSLDPGDIVVAGRQMVRRARWLTASVTGIDFNARTVRYSASLRDSSSLAYDHLVLACGSAVDLSLLPGMAIHAYPFKTLGDALVLGNDLIGHLERASVTSDAEERQRELAVVVIGGGFTGVEVVGQISEIIARTRRFYPQLAGERPRLVLLHRGKDLMPELDAPSLSEFALRKLRQAGIDVRLETGAEEVTATGVRLQGGEQIAAATVVSTVGNTTNPLISSLGLKLERGRLPTAPDMRVPELPNVWAIGDCSLVPNSYDGKPSQATAQFAIRQARQLASNLTRALAGETTRPFRFRPLGMLASLGHHNAVAEILGFHVSGLLAWILWRTIYLAKLPTLARKLEVIVDWTWQIFFAPNIVQVEISRTRGIARAHFTAGEVVFRKGEPADRLYVIDVGSATAYRDDDGPPIARLKEGDPLGADALVGRDGGRRYSLSVKAETPLDVVAIGGEELDRLRRTPGALRSELSRLVASQKGGERLAELARDRSELMHATARELMRAPAESLNATATLADAVRRFAGGHPGYAVVDEVGVLRGYCGLTEIQDAMRSLPSPQISVTEIMRTDPPTITESQTLEETAALLLREQIELLPVLAADGSRRVVGMLSPLDIFEKVVAPLEK